MRRLRRAVFLVSVAATVVRYAMARRKAAAPTRAADWAPLPPNAGPPALPPGSRDSGLLPARPLTIVADAPAAWVAPVDGACPLTHPVKGNANSGIYHLPGGQFYDATVAERCYRDAASAQADGMRASKR